MSSEASFQFRKYYPDKQTGEQTGRWTHESSYIKNNISTQSYVRFIVSSQAPNCSFSASPLSALMGSHLNILSCLPLIGVGLSPYYERQGTEERSPPHYLFIAAETIMQTVTYVRSTA